MQFQPGFENDSSYKSTTVPFEVQKHLEFIDITEDGYMLLGSSNLSSRRCTGSVWYFLEAEEAPDKEKCLTGTDCKTSVSDGKFLDSKQKIIVGEDSGAVTVYTLTELEDDHSFHLVSESTRNDHDNTVLTIAVSSDKKQVASGGMDLCIKIWNTEDLLIKNNYQLAHCHHVTNLAFRPQDSNYTFASSSLDGTVLLWDSRQFEPATVLRDTPNEGLSALAWNSVDDNVLAVGSVIGNIDLIDLRTVSNVMESRPFNRAIHKLLYINSNSLAAVAESHEVKVVQHSSDKLNIVYNDERHNDFVRGLAWHPKMKCLFSCGWDKQVIKHNVFAN
uniref:Uncharacterized protein n=2 Tax=Clastoptera arizonana TaxID=38151 RepID=A0A1B6DLS7_9HEMI